MAEEEKGPGPMWSEANTSMFPDNRNKESIYGLAWECQYCYALWIRESRPGEAEPCPRCEKIEAEFLLEEK